MLNRAVLAPLAAVSLMFSLLMGCSNSDTALTTVSDDGTNIVNGKLVTEMTEARSSTVFLASLHTDNSTTFCTGTLIAENLVLTAGHCMPKPDQKDVIVVIGFGANLEESFGKNHKYPFYRVSNAKAHTDYNFTAKAMANAPHDLAIFKFKGALPQGFKVRTLPNIDFKISAADVLEMIGYGNTSETSNDSTVLRATKLPADRITDTIQIKATNKDGSTDEFDVPVPGTIIIKQPDTGVCTGDSGGPLYVRNIEGNLTYVGLTSVGMDTTPSELSTEKKSCHGVSLFVDIRDQLKWITDTAKELNK